MTTTQSSDYHQQKLLQILRHNEGFADFSEHDFETFMNCARIGSCQPGEKVILQGDSRQQFFVVLDGQLRAIDVAHERPRLLNYHDVGEFFGLRTLLYQRPRAATVEVVLDSVVAVFNKSAWDWLWAIHPETIDYFREVEESYESDTVTSFPGQQPDERVIIAVKRHAIAMLNPMLKALMWLLVPTAFLLLQSLASETVLAAFLNHWLVMMLGTVPFVSLTVLLGLYHYLDWRNDDFIVTTNRVIHIERILFYGEERHEAPLSRVQDVTLLTSGFVSDLVDCSDVAITTAGVGVIRLTSIPEAEAVKEAILAERHEAVTRLQAADALSVRQSLAERLNLTDAVPTPMTLLEKQTPPAEPAHPPKFLTALPAWFKYLIPLTTEITVDESGEVALLWRQHYGILLFKAVGPLLLSLISGYLLLASTAGLPPLTYWPDWWVRLPLGLMTVASIAWYVWQYDGWQRDVYMVTPTRIIDVESSNFRLKGEFRREGTFDTIQNITYHVPNLLSKLLNVGDVVIESAGSRETFTFSRVFNPSGVQQEIFSRMLQHQQQRKEQTREQNTTQFMDMLNEYHNLFEQARPDLRKAA